MAVRAWIFVAILLIECAVLQLLLRRIVARSKLREQEMLGIFGGTTGPRLRQRLNPALKPPRLPGATQKLGVEQRLVLSTAAPQLVPAEVQKRRLLGSATFECKGCLAVGYNHACAINASGALACWGELEYTTTFEPHLSIFQPLPPSNFTSSIVASVTSKWYHSCAISTSRQLQCWGWDGFHQCATPPAFQSNVYAVSTGFRHTCAVSQQRNLECWGSNEYNQSQVLEDFASDIELVALGRFHTCAVNRQQELECWGYDVFNQTQVPEEFRSGVVSVSCGDYHTCALKSEGQVNCWGNYYVADIPDAIRDELDADKAVQLVAAPVTTCAQHASQQWLCWGTPDVLFNQSTLSSYDIVYLAGAGLSPGCYVTTASEVRCSGRQLSRVPASMQYLAGMPVAGERQSSSSGDATSGGSGGGISTGVVVGVVVGVILLLAFALGVGAALWVRRRRAKRRKDGSSPAFMSSTGRVPILVALKPARHGPPLDSIYDTLADSQAYTCRNDPERPPLDSAYEHPPLDSAYDVPLPHPDRSGDTGTGCSRMDSSSFGRESLLFTYSEELQELQSLSSSAKKHLDSSSSCSAGVGLIRAEALDVDVTADGQLVQLGRGAFSKVYRGHMHDVPVAIKVLQHTAQHAGHIKSLLREVCILRRCCHDNVLSLQGVSVIQQDVVMVFELMAGDLFRALRGQAAEEFRWSNRGRLIALDIARGLSYLHSQRIIHCDLKSPNVMLAECGTAKIGDMGMSKFLVKEYVTKGAEMGSYAWAAPELLLNSHISEKVDIYSLGVILWELVTGEPPQRGQLRSPKVPEECPEDILNLISACRKSALDARPTAQQVVDILTNHASISKHLGPM